jgi:hypothetical protein
MRLVPLVSLKHINLIEDHNELIAKFTKMG